MRTVALWLSLIMIFVIPWENMIFIEGLGTASRLVGLGVAAFWVATVIVTGRLRGPHPFHIAVFCFLLWNGVSAFWSVDLSATLTSLKTYVQLAVLSFVLWDLCTSPAALKAGLQAYVLGAYVAIGGTIVNYFAAKEAGDLTYLRFSATGFNENDLGLIMALGLPVAWYLAVSESDSRMTAVLRPANYAYVPAAILAIVLTASRGSLVAALPAVLFAVGTLTRLNLFRRTLILVALISALFALQTLVPQSSLQRLATTGTSIAEGDIGGRVDIWREGLAAFIGHPLFGTGSGTFKAAVRTGASHNSFLSILVEIGLIGFGLLAIILSITAHRATCQSKWESRFWLTLLLVLAIGNSVHNWERRKPTWLFPTLVIVSSGLSARREEPPHMPNSLPNWSLLRGETDEANSVNHMAGSTGPDNADGHRGLSFRHEPDRDGQHLPYRRARF